MVKIYNAEELAELLAIHKAATGGEWKLKKSYGEWSIIPIFQGVNGYNGWYEGPDEGDVSAIISAHEALPNLIAQVKELESEFIASEIISDGWKNLCTDLQSQLTAAEKVIEYFES